MDLFLLVYEYKYFTRIFAEVESPLDVDDEFLVAFVISALNINQFVMSLFQLNETFFDNVDVETCSFNSLQFKLELSKVLQVEFDIDIGRRSVVSEYGY